MAVRFSVTAIGGKRRKPITLRPIVATNSMELELLSIYREVTDYWARQVSEHILPTYGVTMLLLKQDAATDNLTSTLATASDGSGALLLRLRLPLLSWVSKSARTHFSKWIAALKSVLGFSPDLMQPSDTVDVETAALERNVALIRNVSEKVQADISRAVWDAVAQGTPRNELAKQLAPMLDGSVKRAKFIARDQTTKLSANLDQFRQQQAGIEQYKWQHSGKAHPRPEHVARNGKIFRWDTPPWDGPPGTAPNCGCHALAYIPLLDEVEKELEAA
jgi:SPP1 gp7 family putative phage head morphogenesis protein